MRWALEHGMVVRRIGDAKAPRIVWVHGLGESSVSFEPVVGQLPGFAHLLVDLPGYGRSPWPEKAPSIVAVAEGLATWLAGEPPAVVIGHSMGGVIATIIGELVPVRGVVDIDGNLTRGDCTFSAAASEYTLEDFIARGFSEMRARVYADGATRPELRTYHAAMCFASAPVFHRHARELVELSTEGTLGPRLAALKVPKLFIAGVPDGICAASRALLDELRVPWVGIEPAGHWVYLDQLDRFTAELGRFLRRV